MGKHRKFHTKKRWTEEDIQILKDNYSNMSYKDIGKLVNRSRKAVQHQAIKLGLILSLQAHYKLVMHHCTNTRLYGIWCGMISRCRFDTKKEVEFKNYYSRGIKVCEEWINDFVKFKEWAENNGYERHLTIDRKNNNKGYSPDNCRWITSAEQNNNRRDNVIITAFGETKNLTQWSQDIRCKVPRGTLKGRLKGGLDPEIAMTTKDRLRRNTLTITTN